MIAQAEVSLYPLRTEDPSIPITKFVWNIKDSSVEVNTGPMSTRVSGEISEIFSVLSRAFEDIAANHSVVLIVKVSNACPSTYQPKSGGQHT